MFDFLSRNTRQMLPNLAMDTVTGIVINPLSVVAFCMALVSVGCGDDQATNRAICVSLSPRVAALQIPANSAGTPRQGKTQSAIGSIE